MKNYLIVARHKTSTKLATLERQMCIMRYWVFFMLLIPMGSLVSQEESLNMKAELLFYSDVMINANEASSRILASEHFESLLDKYLENNIPTIHSDSLLKYVSIKSNSDSTVHILTWPVKLDESNYSFGGRIITEGRVIPLNSGSSLSDDSPYQQYSSSNWYGCIYYNMMASGPDSYILFGIDPSGAYENKKIVDVMTINEGEVTFGNSSFEDKDSRGSYNERIILQYSSDATVVLNYDEKMGIIIHDHLEPRMGLLQGQGVVSVPDGTYEGYVLKEGKWSYKEKIFDHMYEDGDFPVPVPSTEMGLRKK